VGLTLAALLISSCEAGPMPTRFECDSSIVDMNFWPEGHGVIASNNAPEARDPHVEIAVGNLENLEEVFYFDATGELIRGVASCFESTALLPDGSLDEGAEEHSAARLICNADTEAVIWRSGPDDPPIVVVTASDTVIVRVILAPADPTLAYDLEVCTLADLPS
jgi:hypothetical protein